MDPVAQADQRQAHFRDFAAVTSEYFRELMEHGFTREEAFFLTQLWHESLFELSSVTALAHTEDDEE